MLAQFRQIGVPDARRTNAAVKHWLTRAQRRTETLLSRRQLPAPSTLLRSLKWLQTAMQQAYSILPLQRLTSMQKSLTELHDLIDQTQWFQPLPPTTINRSLRRFYQELTMLLNNLAERRPAQTKIAGAQFKAFLEIAASRGWRVPEKLPEKEELEVDGAVQSSGYVQQVSVEHHQLLRPEDDFGTAEAAIVLLNDTPVPERILVEWTKPPFGLDVYIVFGHYVVLPQCSFLGIRPHLAVTREAGGKATVNINRFTNVADLLDESGQLNDLALISSPRRVLHHYYCPVLRLNPEHRRYFQKWDMLVKQK